MPIMNLPFQFHKPITCLYRYGYYCPFVTHTNDSVRTHDNYLSIFFLSKTKHSSLSIGSIRFHESTPSSKDMVPSVDFGLSEQEEYNDDDDDDDVGGRETVDTSFVSSWGEVDDYDKDKDEDDVVGREEFDTSYVSRKKLPPWREMEDDDEDDVKGREEFDASFVSKRKLPPWGEVEEEEEDDDDEGREEFDTSFMPKKKLPPWGEVDEEDDNDDDVEGRKDVDASLVAKKELLPWGEMEDDGQWDSRPVVSNLSTSEDDGALFLEEMDENVLSNRILELSRTNKTRSGMEYFRSMELLGLCPNIHACNSLLSSLLRNGWFDDCFKVFNFTKAKRITTGHTYSLILMAHVKAEGHNSALKFFRELESECDVEKDFDAVVYNTMISICRDVENWNEIERLWRSMKENGCAGTHVTYRLLINSFVRCDRSELALYAYNEMVQNGFEPDSNILNAIICVCAKEGSWDDALSAFQKMLKGELKPNLVACNALVNSLGRAGELKLAYQVYETMKSLGYKPDTYTFNALLSSLNKANRHHEALEIFDRIERDQTSQFNVHLYNTALMSCSNLGLWDRALEIVWQMETSGLSDLTVSYNLVIRACEVARKPTIAWQVYEHMVHQKCSPNIFTYLSIIRCCVSGDLWEELEEILNQTMPNATLYNAAIQGMCLRRKVDLANKFYTKMLESGLQPDVRTQVLMHSKIRK